MSSQHVHMAPWFNTYGADLHQIPVEEFRTKAPKDMRNAPAEWAHSGGPWVNKDGAMEICPI